MLANTKRDDITIRIASRMKDVLRHSCGMHEREEKWKMQVG